jgi:hypothetical protein
MREKDEIRFSEETMAFAGEGEELIRMAVAQVRAPQALRESIEAERARAVPLTQGSFWRRHRWGLATAAVAALAGIAVATQIGSSHDEPSLTSVYAAAQLGSTEAAPAALGGHPPVLDAKVSSLTFPDWQAKFGWRSVGRREDNLSGRAVTTVLYRNPEGALLGYAVVAGKPLHGFPAGRPVIYRGMVYQVARGAQHTTVTWIQQGHTCVIVAPSTVPQSQLVDLAASRAA